MAWSSTWTSSNIAIGADAYPAVKDLLYDLCSAIQERYRFLKQDSCEFITATASNVEEPSASDFVGASIQYVDIILDRMVDNLSLMLTGTNRFYTTVNCTTAYTETTLFDEVGILTWSEFQNIEWKSLEWWETFQAVLKKLRYTKNSPTITYDSAAGTYGSIDVDIEDAISIDTLWGMVEDNSGGGPSSIAGWILGNTYVGLISPASSTTNSGYVGKKERKFSYTNRVDSGVANTYDIDPYIQNATASIDFKTRVVLAWVDPTSYYEPPDEIDIDINVNGVTSTFNSWGATNQTGIYSGWDKSSVPITVSLGALASVTDGDLLVEWPGSYPLSIFMYTNGVSLLASIESFSVSRTYDFNSGYTYGE